MNLFSIQSIYLATQKQHSMKSCARTLQVCWSELLRARCQSVKRG